MKIKKILNKGVFIARTLIRRILDVYRFSLKKKIPFMKDKPLASLINLANLKELKDFIHDTPNLVFLDELFHDDFIIKIKTLYPFEVEQIIDAARNTCKHRFKIFSNEYIDAGIGLEKFKDDDQKPSKSINWNHDFINDFQWNNETLHYKAIQLGLGKGDPKVPWELSRMHHLLSLGLAFRLEKRKEYCLEFEKQIRDWIKANPVGVGINWACTMDVGIRATNLLIAMELFKGLQFPDDFLELFYKSIHDHGKFICNHLEYFSGLTTNHLVGDLVGLLFISIKCPFYKTSRKWKDIAINKLIDEAKKQVYPDGVDFEGSTCYHALVLEMFLFSYLACERAGTGVLKDLEETIIKMLEFLKCTIQFNGQIPQIGDNDSSRLFKIWHRDSLFKRQFLDLAAIYFNDERFKVHEDKPDLEAILFLGTKAVEIWKNLSYKQDAYETCLFKDAGWAVIKTDKDYCFFSAGYNGQNGVGGHGHNDKLGFELILFNQKLFVDPGSYIYSARPDLRNEFRSTRFHNTVLINGKEQNEITSDIFRLSQDSVPRLESVNETKDCLQITGWLHYENGLVHKRTVRLDKLEPKFVIEDTFQAPKENEKLQLEFIFILHPRCKFDEDKQQIESNDVKLLINNSEHVKFESKICWYSPGYGIREKTICLHSTIVKNGEVVQVRTVIRKI
ncbi:MAG: alginate lyase family protein [Promethearchaeota archaeon]